MPSKHLILCCPLLLQPSIIPSIRVFSNELALHIRWPKYWSFSFSISPSSEYSGLISSRMDSSVLNFHNPEYFFLTNISTIFLWKAKRSCFLRDYHFWHDCQNTAETDSENISFREDTLVFLNWDMHNCLPFFLPLFLPSSHPSLVNSIIHHVFFFFHLCHT